MLWFIILGIVIPVSAEIMDIPVMACIGDICASGDLTWGTAASFASAPAWIGDTGAIASQSTTTQFQNHQLQQADVVVTSSLTWTMTTTATITVISTETLMPSHPAVPIVTSGAGHRQPTSAPDFTGTIFSFWNVSSTNRSSDSTSTAPSQLMPTTLYSNDPTPSVLSATLYYQVACGLIATIVFQFWKD